MAEIVTMLALSPTMEAGRLVQWSKAEGDTVEEGEIIAEIETDKATMDMESFFDGIVLKILVDAGQDVKVGTAMAVIGEEGEDISDLLAEAAAQSEAGPTPATDSVPESPAVVSAAVEVAPVEPKTEHSGRVFSSPLARKIAQANNLDLRSVKGSGPRGRVVKQDVEAALSAGVGAAVARGSARRAISDASHRQELTPMRRTIAQRMTLSWTTAPHFALTTEIDMDKAVEMRSDLNSELLESDSGYKVSYNDFVVKACALALSRVPEMNVAWGGDHVVVHEGIHIGVAVALEGGLITPVIRHANVKSVGEIAQEVRELAGRARQKRLMPEEYSGSTFSVSNLGMFGITQFQAVLNPPEAGILAVGGVVQKPVVRDGQLGVGHRMSVTLSCDHRSTDGALGASFLKEVRRLMERPLLLFL
jgi:pyruvate dehydrogenase E2 component (dihydrolipoamide acetyltransferase)